MNTCPLRDLMDGYCPKTGRPRSGLMARYHHLLPLRDASSERDKWVMAVLLDMDRRNVWRA